MLKTQGFTDSELLRGFYSHCFAILPMVRNIQMEKLPTKPWLTTGGQCDTCEKLSDGPFLFKK